MSRDDLSEFAAEARNALPRLRDSIECALGDPNPREHVDEARRIAAVLKDAASTAGRSRFSEAAFALEFVFEQIVRSGQAIDETEVDLLLIGLEALDQAVPGLADGNDVEEAAALALDEAFQRYRDREPPALSIAAFPADEHADIEDEADDEKEDQDQDEDEDEDEEPEPQAESWDVELDDPATIDPDLLSVFAEEAESHLTCIQENLESLLKTPDDREGLQEVRRAAHTLKGAAGAVKLRGLTRLAHRMEDLLDKLCDGGQSPSEDDLALLLATSDSLTELAAGRYESDPMRRALVSLMERYAKRLAGPGHAHAHAHAHTHAHSVPAPAPMPPAIPKAADPASTITIEDLSLDPSSPAHIDPELFDVFAEEAQEHMDQIRLGIESLRASPRDREALLAVRRGAHTLKGAAGAMKLKGLSKLSKHMESLMDHHHERGMEIGERPRDWLAGCARILGDLIEGRRDEETLSAIQDLTARQQALLNEEPAEAEDFAPEPEGDSVVDAEAEAETDISDEIAALGSSDAVDAISTPPEAETETEPGSRTVPKSNLDSWVPISPRPKTKIRTESAPVPGPAPQAAESPLLELKGSESIAPELREVFAMEAEDRLGMVFTSLDRLAQQPGDPESIETIRKSAQTLRIAAEGTRLRGFALIAGWMENLTQALLERRGVVSQAIRELLSSTADILRDLAMGRFDKTAVRTAAVALRDGYAELHLRFQEKARENLEEDGLDWAKVDEATAQLAAETAARRDPAANAAPAVKKSGETLRIPIDRVDELVRLVSELVISRTTFEQRMLDMARMADEIRASVVRLQQVSTALETEYETRALSRGRLSWLGPASPAAPPGSPSGPRGLPSANGPIPVSPPPSPMSSPLGMDAAQGMDGVRRSEFDELEMDRYTQFHLLSRSMSEATSDLHTCSSELNALLGDFSALLNRQARLTREAQDKLTRARMVPLGNLSAQLQRTVRSVATQQQKKVDLVIEGERVELDKTVLDEMADPFLHLLRNAVDHGIESPESRRGKGKPEKATIRIKAYYQGTQIVIAVSDDGAGINADRVRRTAIRNGLVSETEADALPRDELLQLIFAPGFSTAEKISEVSGRGVGMDVVKSKISRLKGTLAIETAQDAGTTFTIRLPMTMAITQALLVKANNETFALPVQSVNRVARIDRDRFEKVDSDPVVRLGDRVYPLMHLGALLKLRQPADLSSVSVPLMIVSAGNKQLAIVVDQLVANREIVVKSLGSFLKRAPGLIGATLLGDGTVVPILNIAELVQESGRIDFRRAASRVAKAARTTEAKRIMIVDDSVSVRRVVSNLLKSVGWIPNLAKDGLNALEILQIAEILPDLILLDIEMPRMDGYELLASLRSQPAFATIPIVMMTSRAGQKHRRKAMNLGASDYVVKPYQDDALLALIRSLTEPR